MTFDPTALLAAGGPPRLLLEVPLHVAQGTRFQPTGFPDLGPALFKDGEGKDRLLVESPQSIANRLEAVCWDEAMNDVVPELQGMSYVRVLDADGQYLTSSVVEAHRLNSPYILGDTAFRARLKEATDPLSRGPIHRPGLAAVILRYDANALLHGVFLAQKDLAGGRLRLERALSGFVEAEGVRTAASGGVKKDEVNPSGAAKDGFGHVPFSRDEFTASDIRAFFNLDLAQIRSYGLPQAAGSLLVAVALYKVRAFLEGGLRLRTACDLEAGEPEVSRPEGFSLPDLATLREALPGLVGSAGEFMGGGDCVTTVTYPKSVR